MSDRFDSHDQFTDSSPRPRRRRRGRRWPWILLVLLILLLALPNLITLLGLERYAIDTALSDFKGKLTVGRSSVGWFQPITLKNVSAFDEAGKPLFSAAEVRTSKRLFSFINTDDFGHIELKQPVVNLHLRPDGSNLEDAIANYIPAETTNTATNSNQNNAATPLPKVSISIIDGAATVTSSTTPEAWSVDQLNMATEVSVPRHLVPTRCRRHADPAIIWNAEPVGSSRCRSETTYPQFDQRVGTKPAAANVDRWPTGAALHWTGSSSRKFGLLDRRGLRFKKQFRRSHCGIA